MIRYTIDKIIVTDDNNPIRAPLVIAATATTTEIEAAVFTYLGEEATRRPPDYVGFYDEMLVSTVYQTVMTEPSTPDQVKAMLAFVSQLQECMSGRENRNAMQSSIWRLLSLVPLSQVLAAELFGLMNKYHLAGVYQLQP